MRRNHPKVFYKFIEEPNLKPKKILIVDDQGFNIDAVKVVLKYSVGVIDIKKICDSAFNGK